MACGLGHLAYGVWLIAYGYLPQCPVESVDSLTHHLFSSRLARAGKRNSGVEDF
jgi:hypothetical protein